jgi:hypothetical protein
MGDEVRKYLEDLAYRACEGREMRTTLDKIPAWVLRDAELEKFAELIVLKCADIADKAEPYQASDLIKKHFGVEA